MNRRTLLSAAVFLAFARNAHAAAEMVEIETFDSNGKSLGLSRVQKTVKTEAEWRACFAGLGLQTSVFAVGDGTPFANHLFRLTKAL